MTTSNQVVTIADNDRGYALISVVFMVAAMIATAMICAYPLAYECKKQAREVITQSRDLKVKRALLGRLAEQTGGEFGNCGGLFSDVGSSQASMAGSRHLRMAFTKRGFLTGASSSGGDWKRASYAEPFAYDTDKGFWAGYRGKRYYSMGPADRSEDPEFFDGHGHAYSLKLYCPVATPYYSFKSGRSNFMVLGHHLNYRIRLRDYTRITAERITMEMVVARGQKVIDHKAGNFPGGDNDGRPQTTEVHGSHHLHTFRFQFSQDAAQGRRTDPAGLCKVLIRIDGKVVYTTGLVSPFYGRLLGGGVMIDDLFSMEMEYHG
jgi:hypothetical protein